MKLRKTPGVYEVTLHVCACGPAQQDDFGDGSVYRPFSCGGGESEAAMRWVSSPYTIAAESGSSSR